MDKQTLNEKIKQLAAAYSCCPELKASGAKYCDCPACKLGLEILANKAVLLA